MLGRAAAAAALLLAGAGAAARETPLRVVATIEPLCMLARELGRELVTCTTLVPPGVSPHAFEPRPSALACVADADLLLRAGNGVDDWALTLAKAGTRSWTALGPACERGDQTCAHFWIDPGGALQAAPALAQALRRLDPAAAPELDRSVERFSRDAFGFAMAVEHSRQQGPRVGFVALHPAWGEFAKRFGLVDLGAIQSHGAEEPTPRRLAELISSARASRARIVLVEAQLDSHTARIVAEELGAKLVTVDPLGSPRDPARASYFAMLRWNAGQIAAALAEAGP